MFGLLIRCDLVTGIGESGTALTTGLGISGDTLGLLGSGTLRTGLVGGEIGAEIFLRCPLERSEKA